MTTAGVDLDREPLTQWLGGLPAGWDVARLYRLFQVVNGSTPSSREPNYWGGDIAWVTPDDLGSLAGGRISEGRRSLTREGYESCGAKIVPPGSLVLSTRAPIGYVAIAESSLCTNQGCRALVPRSAANERYYRYVLEAARPELEVLGQGATFVELSSSDLSEFWLPLPSNEVQRAIADFLDEKAACIDQIVEDKKRLIGRLEEKRQALIRHSVSRGLDEQRPTKDARLPWLESIPEDWDEVQIRFVARIESGHTPSRSKPEYWAPEKLTVPWVTLADVWQMREARREYIEDTEEMISEEGVANSGARVLPKGTVMLSRTASVGFSGIMAHPMATSQDFANWVCGPDLVPEFLLYVFRSMKPEFERLMTGSTHQTIYMPEIRRLMTPLPPREEQKAIVKSLRARLGPLDSTMRDVRAQIDVLQEYRSSLITAAVTGEIDVRASTPAVA